MNALTTQLPQTAPNEKLGYTMLDIVFMSVFAVLLVFFGASAAYAFSAPAAGTPGYEAYDLIVNDIIKGPIGQAGGVFFMAKGASELNQNPWKAGATVVGGGLLFQAEALSTSFGFPISALLSGLAF